MKNIIFILCFVFGVSYGQKNVEERTGRGLRKTESCKCVPYYLCKDDKLFQMEEGIIDVGFGDDYCESYLEVPCCEPAEEPITPAPLPNRGCGYRNPKGVDIRMFHDTDDKAQFGEFPWIVAILVQDNQDNTTLNLYKCTGSLIHPRAVITAAHCIDQEKTYKIRAGEWDTQTQLEYYPHQSRMVETFTVHKDYNKKNLHNDIAILLLESPFEIAPNVATLCLPKQDTVIPGGTKCYASGWGKDSFGKEGQYSVIMNKVEVPLVDHDVCQKQLWNTRLGTKFILDKSFVCAGGAGKDTCGVTGGSPLMCPIPGQQERYHHVGIVGWGIGCSELPTVYVNLGLFRNWIDEQMTKFELDTSTYVY